MSSELEFFTAQKEKELENQHLSIVEEDEDYS